MCYPISITVKILLRLLHDESSFLVIHQIGMYLEGEAVTVTPTFGFFCLFVFEI